MQEKKTNEIIIIRKDGETKQFEGDQFIVFALQHEASGKNAIGEVCLSESESQRSLFYMALLYQLKKFEEKDVVLRSVRCGFDEGVFNDCLEGIIDLSQNTSADTGANNNRGNYGGKEE